MITTFKDKIEFNTIMKSVFKKGVLTNCLKLPFSLYHDDLLYITKDTNLILLEHHTHHYKMYYYVNDLDSFSSLLDDIKSFKHTVSLEVYDKDNKWPLDTLLASYGSLKLHRLRMKKAIELDSNAFSPVFLDKKVATLAYKELTTTFDQYFGCIPSKEMWLNDLDNDHVLGIPGGYGFLHESHKKSTAYLLHMLIFEKARGKGHGTELLQSWLDYLQASPHIKTAELWVGKENSIARKLYESVGFKTDPLQAKCYILGGTLNDE